MTTPKLPKIDPSVVYICIQGHVSKAGNYRTGQRLRGSDAGVTTAPVHWMPDGSTEEETHQAIVVRFGGGAVRFGPQT